MKLTKLPEYHSWKEEFKNMIKSAEKINSKENDIIKLNKETK